MVKMKPYAIFDSIYDLQQVDLYSGGESDPVIDASVYAAEHLAFNASGGRLPFSIQVGLDAQSFDRSRYFIEDLDKSVVRVKQRLVLTIIVWSNYDDYIYFESKDSQWGELI